ncbi:MAG: hypothetical protein E7053_03160 [Lentisphaerae bacterium]|nr:hypothetical protein [Lentisphaerota bacterium]
MRFIKLICGIIAGVLITGCASTMDEDILSPSDLTLEELEARRNAATDPEGRFAASGSYIMRQEIVERYWVNDDIIRMVEVKFAKPDKIALITYENNKPATVFCTDGSRGWLCYYSDRKIVQFDESGLRRMQMLVSLGRPGGGSYRSIFARVEVFCCVNDEGRFYRIDCYGEESPYPVCFYLDAENYLPRMVRMKVPVADGSYVDYVNRIKDYEMRDGVNIPMTTVVEQDGVTHECKVIFYQLNPVFSDSEFLPPVF